MPSDLEPPVHATRMASLALSAEDPSQLASYYVDVLGLVETARTDDAVYLTTGPEHHCLIVESAPGGRFGIEIAEDLDTAAARLDDRGVAYTRRSDPEPGIAADLVLADVPTAPLHLYEGQTGAGVASVLGPRPAKYGHVAWTVGDPAEAKRFFEETLGFRWSDSVDSLVHFLRCDPNHHALNLFAGDPEAGLHHFAFETRDAAHQLQLLDHLAAHDVRLFWGPGRHGPGHNLFSYHHDPAGHMVEISTEMDLVFDESDPVFQPRPWHGDLPQRPKVWALGPEVTNTWGPLPSMIAEELDAH